MQTLISAQSLRDELDSQDLILLDCRFYLTDLEKAAKEYQKGHIPGAIFVDVHHHLASPETPLSGRHPLPSNSDFSYYLKTIGITSNSNVVVYDDMSGAIAARAWWMLSQNNIKTRVLDGGLKAWLASKGEMVADLVIPTIAKETVSISFPWAVDEAAVLENIETGSFQLIDARANDRFEGQNETIDAIAGHVPGALNRPFSKNLNDNGLFVTSSELASSFDELGVKSECVHYCGSGITACHNVLANVHSGGDNKRVFVGSWSQWSKRMQRLMAEQQES